MNKQQTSEPIRFLSESIEATIRLGRALGTAARAGDVVALVGDLGAGKTHFVQALARGIGVPESVRVTSPTFTLVNIYEGGRAPLVHADLYRLEREGELAELGLDDWIEGRGIVAVEWADKFRATPIGCLELRLEVKGDNVRTVTVHAESEAALEWLERWQDSLA